MICELVFIEIDSLDAQKLQILQNTLKKISKKIIYIFTTEPNDSKLFKIALHYSVKRVLGIKNETTFLKQVLNEGIKQCHKSFAENREIYLSKKLDEMFALIMINNLKVTYLNEKAKEILDVQDYESAEKRLFSIDGFLDFLNQNVQNATLQGKAGEIEYRFDFSKCIGEGNETVIAINNASVVKQDNLLESSTNRITFISYLQEALGSSSFTTLSMFNLLNYKKILERYGFHKAHEIGKVLLKNIVEELPKDTKVAQWSIYFYIFLIKDEEFDKITQKVEKIHNKLHDFDIDESDVMPTFVSSALDITGLKVEEAINIIEQISEHKFKSVSYQNRNFFELYGLHTFGKKDEQIHYQLIDAMLNEKSVKLLNVYKGLCIHTSAKVIKSKDDAYLLHCDLLQIYSMSIENRVVLQLEDFYKDIEADVLHINYDKSNSHINNIRIMEESMENIR
jgi:GGDEF domain-containing protein/predicted hydrocarbon binding protein